MSLANITIFFDPANEASPNFKPTQWSLVHRAGDLDSFKSQEALETLCREYWFPIYSFIRRNGRAPHDAQDLTQEFFARLLEKNSFANANPHLGKFRTFLLGALKNFLTDTYRKANAGKRGGGKTIISFDEAEAEKLFQSEPADDRTPDKLFEQRWTLVLLETGIARLRKEFRDSGKERQFEALKEFLSNEGDVAAYEQVASKLNTSAKTVAVAVHRIRRRFRQVVRSGIAETVSTPDEVEEEYQSLFI